MCKIPIRVATYSAYASKLAKKLLNNDNTTERIVYFRRDTHAEASPIQTVSIAVKDGQFQKIENNGKSKGIYNKAEKGTVTGAQVTIHVSLFYSTTLENSYMFESDLSFIKLVFDLHYF